MIPIYQLRKEVEITDRCLHKEGIEIEYIMKGQDYKLVLNKEQACEMLKEIGSIEDYGGGDVSVLYDNELSVLQDHRGTERLAHMSFEAFVMSYTLSQHEALSIVAIDFDRKQNEKWAREVSSIPALIVDMTKPDTYFEQAVNIVRTHNKINYGI